MRVASIAFALLLVAVSVAVLLRWRLNREQDDVARTSVTIAETAPDDVDAEPLEEEPAPTHDHLARGVVVDAAGKAIGGSMVSLRWMSPWGTLLGERAAQTSSDGSFEFADDEDAPRFPRAELVARAEGYAPAVSPVRVGSGDPTLIVLAELARIHGTASTEHPADAAQGVPVADARVSVVVDGALFETVTDASGSYSIDVPPGDVSRLEVYAPRFGVTGRRDPFGRLVVFETLDASSELREDFVWSAGGAIEGTVFAPDGSPDDGARVVLSVPRKGATERREIATDAEGKFVLESLPADEYVLRAASQRGVTNAGDGECPDAERLLTVPVGTRERVRVTVRLEEWATVTGRALSATGALLAGLRVEVVGELTFDAAETESDGRFRLLAPTGRHCRLRILDGGWIWSSGFAPLCTGQSSDAGNIRLYPRIDVTLTVADPAGRRVAGARVLPFVPDPRPGEYDRAAVDAGRTNDDGIWRARLPSERMVHVELVHPGSIARLLTFVPRSYDDDDRGKPSHRTVVLAPHGSAVVRGRVVDVEGNAITGCRVEVRPMPVGFAENRYSRRSLETTVSDGDGQFFARGLSTQARYAIDFSSPGYDPQRLEAVACDDGALEIVLSAVDQ